MTVAIPHPGIKVYKAGTEGKITVVRLHYTADPEKCGSPLWYAADIKKYLTPWARGEYDRATDKRLYAQEMEVDGSATDGERVYAFDEEVTVEAKSFPIPRDWTRYYTVDPHPGVPHCSLWGAVDPHGDLWIYREFWPSKVYGRWERGGNIPEDDTRMDTRDYCEALKYFELGADEVYEFHTGLDRGNPENVAGSERIHRRVIDYAARGFGKDKDDPNSLNYQQRFVKYMTEFGLDNPYFEDAIKADSEAGVEAVNEWLKPRLVEDMSHPGQWMKKSKLHIFRDKCPELILQLLNNRRQQLTLAQAEKMDPTGKPVAKRNHATDCLKYMVRSNPEYVRMGPSIDTWRPLHNGIAY